MPISTAVVNDSVLLIGGWANIVSCAYPFIFAYDQSGNLIWTLAWDKPIEADAIYTDSLFIYAAGYNIGADDYYGEEYVNIDKLNAKGELIFSQRYREDHSDNNGRW